jgi:hypothetical protein
LAARLKPSVSVVSSRQWALWATACVFCLFLISYAQHEFHALELGLNSFAADFSLYDFAAYYVAGKVTAEEKRPVLYYPATGSQYSNPTGRHVDPSTEWASVGRAQGFGVTQHYIYPPLFALLISPLTHVPPRSAYIIWRQINLALLLLTLVLALKSADTEFSWPIFLIMAIAALSFFPYHETAYLGQVGGLILFLWTLGVYFTTKSQPLLSAGCFALGTMIKVTPVLVVPLLLLRRQWKWLYAYTAWMVFLLGVSIWRFGWQSHVIYFSKVMPAMSCGFPLSTNVSLTTVLQSLHAGRALLSEKLAFQAEQNTPSWLCTLAKTIGLGIYIATLWVFTKERRSAGRLPVEMATLALVSVLVSPVAWRHSYLVTLLPVVLLWVETRREVFSGRKYLLLFLATTMIGTAIPEYVLVHLRRSVLDVAVIGIVPAAAVILLLFSIQINARRSQLPSSQAVTTS